jgi:hypothetical protein
MESFVSADLGTCGGSYNPDEEEDESSGNWIMVSKWV